MTTTASELQLQLRILSGMHAGARAPLSGDEYVLGASEACDFVLLDPLVQPRHAKLSRDGDGWQLDWVAEEDKEPVLAPMRLERGQAVPLGPIVIAVDTPDAPWPTLEQLVLVPHAPALEPQLPPPVQDEPKGGDQVRGLRRFFARGAVTTAIAATGCLSALGMVVSPMLFERHASTAASAAAAPAPAMPGAAQRPAVEAVLRDLGFASRARVEATELGLVVHAGVVTEGESEALRTALARIRPRPMLRATAEEDLRDAMTDALNRIGTEYHGKLAWQYAGEGRVRIEGRVAPGTDRDRIGRALAAALPQVGAWDNAVDTGEGAATEMMAQLRSMGWQVAGDWDGAKLDMQVTLQQRDVARWEQSLMAAARSATVPFTANLQFAQTATAPAANARFVAEGRPPFGIRSVVGGELPYVQLTDGEKLAPGAVWQGWKLAAIAPNQIVFENGARRAIVPR